MKVCCLSCLLIALVVGCQPPQGSGTGRTTSASSAGQGNNSSPPNSSQSDAPVKAIGNAEPTIKSVDFALGRKEDERRLKLAGPEDWPNLFGPRHDQSCLESNLKLSWPRTGPKQLYRRSIGESYTSPSIVGDAMYLFHRMGDEEVIERCSASTGKTEWKTSYPTKYVDRYGYNNGPRCTPIVAGNRIYTFGAEGVLTACDATTGKQIWQRALNQEYNVPQGFFGVGATPILVKTSVGERLVINLGGVDTESGVIAIDIADGKTVWKATSDGASYATPRFAEIHGKPHVFVFTQAGVVDLDPNDGKVRWQFAFRSGAFESVNATSPLIYGDIVLFSASYNTGSICLQIKPDGLYQKLWQNKQTMQSHFSNMLVLDGYVYGFSGRHENGCLLSCIKLATGELVWKEPSKFGRGSFLQVGNSAIVWGERGHLSLIKLTPNGYEEQITPTVELFDTSLGFTWPPPVISHGRLFLRDDRLLTCYDLTN